METRLTVYRPPRHAEVSWNVSNDVIWKENALARSEQVFENDFFVKLLNFLKIYESIENDILGWLMFSWGLLDARKICIIDFVNYIKSLIFCFVRFFHFFFFFEWSFFFFADFLSDMKNHFSMKSFYEPSRQWLGWQFICGSKCITWHRKHVFWDFVFDLFCIKLSYGPPRHRNVPWNVSNDVMKKRQMR